MRPLELDEIYELHVNDLYRYLYSLSKDHFTAEDLVQETFYRAFITLDEREITNIKAWLFKVSYHAFIDFTRKRKRYIVSDQLENIEPKGIPPEKSPEKQFIEKESFQQLLEDIHSLNDKQKNVLLLCDFHKLSYKEAADILDLNLNTLKSHLLRGREKMIAKIQKRRERDERER